MIRRRVLLVCLVFGLLLPSFAQRRGGSTTTLPSSPARTLDVNIRVSYPNDHPADKGIEVTLVAAQGGIVQQSFTDDMGAVTFHGVPPGQYRIRLAGIDVETTEAGNFELTKFESSHYEYVHVTPKADKSQAAGAAGMVSAAELNIPEKAKKEFDRGLESMQKSDDKKALEHFEKATSIYPQYSQAYNNIGVIEVKAGQTAEARQAFETAVSLNPKSASSYLNLARMSMTEQKYPEADQFISKALTAEPNRVDAVALAAQTKLMLGDSDAAYAYARKVHSMGDHKNYAVVHLICARVLQQRNEPAQALTEYKQFLEESPNSPSAPQVRDAIAHLGGAGK